MQTWLIPTFILCGAKLCGEFSQYLINAVAKDMFQKLEIGDQSCMADQNAIDSECSNLNQTICQIYTTSNNNSCKYDYTGTGTEYNLLTVTFYTFFSSITMILTGVLTDKMSNKAILATIGAGISSVGTICTVFSTNFTVLLINRFVDAFGTAMNKTVGANIIDQITNGKNKAIAMAIYNYGIYVGFSGAIYLGNVVDWKTAYLIVGIPSVAITVLCFLFIRQNLVSNSEFQTQKFAESVEDEVKTLSEEVKSSPEAETETKTEKWPFHMPVQYYVLCGSVFASAVVRHAAAITFAANFNRMFNERLVETGITTSEMIGLLIFIACVIGGIGGSSVGGYLSGLVVTKFNKLENCYNLEEYKNNCIKARILIIGLSSMVAGPVSLGNLYLPYPYCFITLAVTWFFAEMWFPNLLSLIFELTPKYKATCFALSWFVIDNVAGLFSYLVDYWEFSLVTH